LSWPRLAVIGIERAAGFAADDLPVKLAKLRRLADVIYE
jgi:hypothetical protein